MYIPSVTYPLSNSFFTKAQLESIQRPALSTVLQNLGYNKHTARVIIHGSPQYGGIQIPHLYTKQGIAQIQRFIQQWRQPQTRMGKLLRILVHWTQFALAFPTCFLSDTNTPLPHLEPKWLKSLRDSLNTLNASLQRDKTGIPLLQRQNDEHRMARVLKSQRFNFQEIRYINYC